MRAREREREGERKGRDFSPKHILFRLFGTDKIAWCVVRHSETPLGHARDASLSPMRRGRSCDGDRSILRQLLLLFSARARVQQATATALVTATLCILFARCTHQSTITFSLIPAARSPKRSVSLRRERERRSDDDNSRNSVRCS